MTRKAEASRNTLISSFAETSSKLSAEDFSLIVLEGPHKGLSFRMEREIIRIGRADWCDVVLSEDHWVSSIHCECWLDERGVRIRDLGSRNGILLDGCPVFDAYLMADARMKIGESLIQLKSHNQRREIAITYRDESGLLVGKSPKMRKIFSMLPRLGTRNVATLLTGETGTGKTTVAQAIHKQSDASDGPFVVVNCGALPAGLIEAALFGHEKGAFTGADARRPGFFEQADGGSLFLDEIAELPLELQPKLLDVIERKTVRRLGGTTEQKVDFRLICATHRNLPLEIEEGRFREDLFFRISVIELEVPALRERIEDIPLLVEKLLLTLSPRSGVHLSEQAMRKLTEHLWPGNIRQLRNVLERSITFLEGNTIEADELMMPTERTPGAKSGTFQSLAPPSSQPAQAAVAPVNSPLLPSFPLSAHAQPLALKDILVDVEKLLLLQALEESDDNVQEAARLLQISPAWLYNRIKKYDLKSKK